MPLTKRKNKIKADELYVAWQDFAADDLVGVFGYGVVKQGMRLRGDHIAVRLHPGNFVPADTPADEMPSHLDGLQAPPVDHTSYPQVRLLETLPDEQLMEAIEDLSYGLGGGKDVRRGQRLRKDDWRVKAGPEWYKPVVGEAVK